MTNQPNLKNQKAKVALLFCILFAWSIITKAQFTGTGPVYTDDPVKIEQIIMGVGTPGSPMPPPLLNVYTSDYSVGPLQTFNHLYVNYNGFIGLGTATPSAKLHLVGGTFKLTSTAAGPSAFEMQQNGAMNVRTSGVDIIGLTMNNQTADFLKINPGIFKYGISNNISFTKTGEFLIDNTTGGSKFGIDADGNVKITNGNFYIENAGAIEFKVTTTGFVHAREVKVNLNTIWPDYVFEKDYQLMSLDELETFISEHKHLPNVPSAKELEEEGSVAIGDMQSRILEKVEELSLYVIELKKENDKLKERLSKIEK